MQSTRNPVRNIKVIVGIYDPHKHNPYGISRRFDCQTTHYGVIQGNVSGGFKILGGYSHPTSVSLSPDYTKDDFAKDKKEAVRAIAMALKKRKSNILPEMIVNGKIINPYHCCGNETSFIECYQLRGSSIDSLVRKIQKFMK